MEKALKLLLQQEEIGLVNGIIFDTINLIKEGKISAPKEVLELSGMSTNWSRSLLNYLGSQFNNYLEVGSWQGSTLLATIANNEIDATYFENFSESYEGIEAEKFLNKNLKDFSDKKLLIDSRDIFAFKKDFFKNVGQLKDGNKFDLYFYDGPHSEQQQYDALKAALPYLDKYFCFIVDDYNWEQVRTGTINSLFDLQKSNQIKVLTEFSLMSRCNADKETWWNGYHIVFAKKLI